MSVVVLLSGRGSNMQALLDAGIPVSAVISNIADAAGLALAARVLQQEHQLYPRAIRWFLDGELVIEADKVRVKGNHAQMVISDRA